MRELRKGDPLPDDLAGGLGEYRKTAMAKAVRMDEPFSVETLEGTMTGKAGDWLMVGAHGEFYPCDAEIFEKTYEPAPELPLRALCACGWEGPADEAEAHEASCPGGCDPGCANCNGTGKVLFYGSGRFAQLLWCSVCGSGEKIADTMVPVVTATP